MDYGIIAGLVIITIITILFIYNIKKTKPAEEATKFVEDLSKSLVFIFGSTIESYDPKDYDSIEAYRDVVLAAIYENTWNYVSRKAKEELDKNNIINIVFNNITKDLVVDLVNKLLEKNFVLNDINGKYIEYINSIAIKKDSELEEEYSNEDEYLEVSNDEDLEESTEKEIPEEELEKLNPQRDDEEEFDIEDDSMEIVDIDESKPEIISLVDKLGREQYYEVGSDGKKKRVTKEYALDKLGE
jgi:hypothetical protein